MFHLLILNASFAMRRYHLNSLNIPLFNPFDAPLNSRGRKSKNIVKLRNKSVFGLLDFLRFSAILMVSYVI